MYETRACTYELDFDTKSLLWSGQERRTSRARITAASGLATAGQFVVSHSQLVELQSVRVRVQHAQPDAKWLDAELDAQDASTPWIDHSDERQRVHVVRGLRVGDVVETTIVRRYRGAWEVPLHSLGDTDSVRLDRVEYRVPAHVQVATLVRPGDLGWPPPVVSRSPQGRRSTVLFEARNLPGTPPEEIGAPPYLDLVPTIGLTAARVARADGDTIDVRTTWADFAAWYEARTVQTFDLGPRAQEWADRMRSLARDRNDLIESLYRGVQTAVRYVAIEIGEGNWIPHPAHATFASGYGDCKDMSVLLAAALRHAGVPAKLALVRTRDVGSLEHEFPYGLQFNHCIVFVPDATGDWWLDPTNTDALPGEVPGSIAANAALIIDGHASRLAMPASRDSAGTTFLRRFDIGPGSDRVRIEFEFEWTGGLAAEARPVLRVADAERRAEIAKALLAESFANVRDVVVGTAPPARDPSRSTPLLRGTCTAAAPMTSRDGRAAAPRGIAALPLPRVAAARRLPFETGAARLDRTRVRLWAGPVPNAATIATASPVTLQGAFAALEIRTRRDGDWIVAERDVRWTGARVPPPDMAGFVDFLRTMRATNDELVALQ